eukprot:12882312-Prorocentrum_lima.AAC.1
MSFGGFGRKLWVASVCFSVALGCSGRGGDFERGGNCGRMTGRGSAGSVVVCARRFAFFRWASRRACLESFSARWLG